MNQESIQIHLNSQYATKYNNTHYSDVDFSLPVIEAQDGFTMYLSVLHAVIPYSFYSINSTNNVLFYSEYQATPIVNTTLNIPFGNYNSNQLASYLTANLPRTNVTYNNITNKFTFTNTTNEFKILSAFSTCQNLIGVSTDDLYNTSIGRSLTLQKQVNLSTVRMVNIATNLQTGCINNIKNNSQDILACIPVTKSPYSLIDYTNSNNFRVNLNTNTLNFINIKLLDQNGRSLELNQQY
ncbi:MAG: hypothetical protein ACO3UU_07985, partial [Minisyncoccia bacterium]